jgi:hypothetical protein
MKKVPNVNIHIFKQPDIPWVGAPTATVSVEDAAPTKWVFVFNRSMFITDETGVTLKIDGVGATIAGVTGSGTNTLTFTTSETVATGETLTYDYADGNIKYESGSTVFANVTGGAITNNVS